VATTSFQPTCSLPEHAVHVWTASLTVPPADLDALQAVLTSDERHRADRFRFPQDRQKYIAARGLLRRLLSRYLGYHPAAVPLAYGAYGKPYLATDRDDAHRLQFNLSHAGDLALYAITSGRQVGIDVEQTRPIANAEAIAKRFFSEREYAMLLALPAAARTDAFVTCWTRKEAYIKALGEGLSHPLDTFDVAFLPHEPAALLHTRGDRAEAARWCLRDCTPAPGYKATLAVEGHSWHLVQRRWMGLAAVDI
jgi:4'-phosphopantetheinyl transferase